MLLDHGVAVEVDGANAPSTGIEYGKVDAMNMRLGHRSTSNQCLVEVLKTVRQRLSTLVYAIAQS